MGSDFSVNASGAPAFVFQPVAGSVNSTLKLTNTGSVPLFAAPLAALSVPGSFPAPILPGGALYLNPVTAATYLSAGYKAGTSTTTLSTLSSAAGSSSFTVASNTAFPAGTLLLLGSAASSQELLAVGSTTSTTVITTTTSSLLDHVAGSTVSTATAIFGQARVLTGVI